MPSSDALNRAVASNIQELSEKTITDKGHFTLALSGGETPKSLYRLLAAEFRNAIPWSAVHLYWTDERYVPHDDPRSNYGMVREALLHELSIPARNVHPMPTDHADPQEAAAAYEASLKSEFGGTWPHFDLILLGLGIDGHTASLFPGSAAVEEQQKWVTVTERPADTEMRLTLTLPVLNQARNIYFLVMGMDKAAVLQTIIELKRERLLYPAARVQPQDGDPVWWVDSEAASLLRNPS